MDIVITGYAGLDGSLAIYQNKEYKKEILKQYNDCFFGVFETSSVSAENSSENKKREAAYEGLEKLYNKYNDRGLAEKCTNGGVLEALWTVLKANKKGASYSQRLIPIRQQTVEICEMYELNPYMMSSKSCTVWLTEDSGEIISQARAACVPAVIIGYTEKGAAVKRTDGSEIAYLLRPQPDELLKMEKLCRKVEF